ncbi:MAG: hypothetical protein M1421_00035 [Candidatus Eremiobacteraeota bacterium]|nr:hypothetical protein [Candidatus Eremiobacteraeota bacterium]
MKGLQVFYNSFKKDLKKRFFVTVGKDSTVFYLGGDYFFLRLEKFYARTFPATTAYSIEAFLGKKETRTFTLVSFEKFQDLWDHFPESLPLFTEHTELSECVFETNLISKLPSPSVSFSAEGGEIKKFLHKLVPFFGKNSDKVCCLRFKKNAEIDGFNRELEEGEFQKGLHFTSLPVEFYSIFSKETEYRYFAANYILNFTSLFPSSELFTLSFHGDYDAVKISASSNITYYLMPVRKLCHDEEKIFALLDEIKKI